MMIRLLPQNLINQIAAGEVVERPAAALKELVENAIDAGATQIDVKVTEGGKTYFSVTDNGKGMTPDELTLSVERHATSKLPTEDLFNINFLGFRGEALPSIASVARLKITSRTPQSDSAWELSVEGGMKQEPRPASHSVGTTVEVRDLFFATPARLKFLKSAQSEMGAIKDTLNRLAMAYPSIGFSLSDERRLVFSYPAVNDRLKRLDAVIGKSFSENVLPVSAENEGIILSGYVGLPTYTRATGTEQYLFVNGRCIRDKVLASIIRVGYQGLIGHDTFPVVALFLTIPNPDVDVNVHPAKTEVRFKDVNLVKSIIIGAVRNVLAEHGNRTASTIGLGVLQSAEIPVMSDKPHFKASLYTQKTPFVGRSVSFPKNNYVSAAKDPCFLKDSFSVRTDTVPKTRKNFPETTVSPVSTDTSDFPPLGFAKAQLHKTYIVAQTENGIIIVDQHAAHERLTYEKLIKEITEKPQVQALLIPEIITLKTDEVELLTRRGEELKTFGLVIDAFGNDCVAVREIPTLLDKTDLKQLVQDLVDTLKEYNDTIALADKIKDICARMACHGSIRAGRVLTIDEMNALLRQMESCGTAGQCIHGRPTYVELKKNDIEKLFGRRN